VERRKKKTEEKEKKKRKGGNIKKIQYCLLANIASS